MVNQGTLTIGASDSLDATGSVNPASVGLFILDATSVLDIAADTGAGNRMSFVGATSELAIDDIAQFGANVGLGSHTGPLLENFSAADKIDLKNLVLAGATIDSYTAATGLLQLHNGVAKATLDFQTSSLGAGTFHLGTDTSGHVLLTHS